MRAARWLVVVPVLALVGCAPFKLAGSGGTIPAGKTKDQVQLDVLTCKDEAHTESQTPDKQARGFLLGLALSFVGVAIDYEQQKADARRAYSECMMARGYTLTPATD
jgi:hypothetical protein